MTRLIFGLREIRQTVEAQAEAAVLNLEASHATINFSIYCVPPGTQVDPNYSSKFIWPDNTPCAAPEFTPYEATPDWTVLPPPASEPSVMNAETAAVIDVIDDGKVVRLDPYRDRDEPSGVT